MLLDIIQLKVLVYIYFRTPDRLRILLLQQVTQRSKGTVLVQTLMLKGNSIYMNKLTSQQHSSEVLLIPHYFQFDVHGYMYQEKKLVNCSEMQLWKCSIWVLYTHWNI